MPSLLIRSISLDTYNSFIASQNSNEYRNEFAHFTSYDPNKNYIDLRELANIERISIETIQGIIQYDRSTLLAIAYIYIHSSFGHIIRELISRIDRSHHITNPHTLLEIDTNVFELVRDITIQHKSFPDFDKDDLFANILSNFFSIRSEPLNLRRFYYNKKISDDMFSTIESYIDTLELDELYHEAYTNAYQQLPMSYKTDLNYVVDNYLPLLDFEEDLDLLSQEIHTIRFFDDLNDDTIQIEYREPIQSSSETSYYNSINPEDFAVTSSSSSSKSLSIKDRHTRVAHNPPICFNVIKKLKNKTLQETFKNICPYLINKQTITDAKISLFFRKAPYKEIVSITLDETTTTEIDYMRYLFQKTPHIHIEIAKVNYNVGIDAGGLKRQFLTNLSKQLVDRYFTKLYTNIYIFKRGLSPDDYRFIGAILFFLIVNGHSIPVRLALIDVAGLIYQPIKPRKKSDIEIDYEDYADIEKLAKHFELSDGSPKSWKNDIKKTILSYYDVLLFYIIEFGLNNNIKPLIDRPKASIKRIVDENILDIYEYDPYTRQAELKAMYQNILRGLRIHNRNIFYNRNIAISDLAAVFSAVESTRKSVKNILIPQIQYSENGPTKEFFNDILSMSNRTYKKLLRSFVKQNKDNTKISLAKHLPEYDNFLKALLEFWTGSDHILISSLNEYHVKLFSGKGRLPVAHTCGLVLELSREYSNMEELFFKFLDVILIMYSSNEKFQFD